MLDMTGKSLFPTGNKKIENFFEKKFFEIFFEKKLRKRRIVPKNEKGLTLWDSLTYFLLQKIKKSKGGTLLRH